MDVVCGCGTRFSAKNPRAKYCSDRCRKQAQRGGAVVVLQQPVVEGQSERPLGPVATATMAELIAVDRLHTSAGATAMRLASRLDFPGMDTGSAMAAVARQHEASLSAALRNAKTSATEALRDELAARRQRHA